MKGLRKIIATVPRGLSLGAVLLAIAAPAAAGAVPDHQLLGTITGERIGPYEQFKDACGVAIDGHGDVYVADHYDDRVAVFSPTWKSLTQIDGIEPLDAGGVRPIDGPCGLAADPAGDLYVASYHGAVRRYVPAAYPPGEGTGYGAGEVVDPGPTTGIAVDPGSGDLYVDRRTSIARYAAPVVPGDAPAQEIGEGDLEDGYGLAFSGFEGSAGYAATKGYLYVADAATDTVKVYDPATSLTEPVREIRGEGTAEGGFHLADAELAVDPADGHLYLSDDLQPGFEEDPELVVDEFSPAGYYRGSVPPSYLNGFPSFLQAAGPSALAVAPAGPYAGALFVASGNWEGAAVYVFGPPAPAETHLLTVARTGGAGGTVTSIPAAIACGPVCAGEFDAGSTVVLKALPATGSVFAGWSGCDSEPGGSCALGVGEDREVQARFERVSAAAAAGRTASRTSPVAVAGGSPDADHARGAVAGPGRGTARERGAPPRAPAATVVRKGNLQLRLSGRLSPRTLPRHGTAPVAVSLSGRVSTTDGSTPPPPARLRIELNQGGVLDTAGLPLCPLARIAIASSARALSACRGSLVGEGSFDADVVLRGQAPYPTTGKLLLFNAVEHGRPLLYAHLYSAEPFATSFVIRFKISHRARGRFGTVLDASLPEALGSWGHLTAIRMRLSRRWSFGGRPRSYVAAGCPAPAGFPGAVFTLARTTFSFVGGRSLQADLVRSCRARPPRSRWAGASSRQVSPSVREARVRPPREVERWPTSPAPIGPLNRKGTSSSGSRAGSRPAPCPARHRPGRRLPRRPGLEHRRLGTAAARAAADRAEPGRGPRCHGPAGLPARPDRDRRERPRAARPPRRPRRRGQFRRRHPPARPGPLRRSGRGLPVDRNRRARGAF